MLPPFWGWSITQAHLLLSTGVSDRPTLTHLEAGNLSTCHEFPGPKTEPPPPPYTTLLSLYLFIFLTQDVLHRVQARKDEYFCIRLLHPGKALLECNLELSIKAR